MESNKAKYKIICANLGIGAQITQTEFGPHAILNLMPYERKNAVDIDINDECKSLPIGEVRLPPIAAFCTRLEEEIETSLNENLFPIILGGDHSIAVGTWSGVVHSLDAYENFGLIWIDAHLDSNTFETSPSKAYHGMPLAALLGYGQKGFADLLGRSPKLNPKNVVMVGIRSYEEQEHELLKSLGVKIFYMSDISKTSMDFVMKQAVEIVTNGTKGFGVSLDLDVIDPKFAPGVGSREIGGIDPAAFLDSISNLYVDQLKAFEIVEYNPALDVDNKTAFIAKTIVKKIIDNVQ
ncbi:MAG: arginase [Alphaproteobacteria bacterium]|jgi:arginase